MPTADGGHFGPEPEIIGDRDEVTRRLSDKILSAFNHAYAVGETDIARQLREVLSQNEHARAGAQEQRGHYDPLGQADLWVAFVEARNRYKWASESRQSEPGGAEEALEAMKEAYQRWSSL